MRIRSDALLSDKDVRRILRLLGDMSDDRAVGGKKKNDKRRKKTKRGNKERRKAVGRHPAVRDSVVPASLAEKLGDRESRRVEKLFRAALAREFEVIIEREARNWARAMLEAEGFSVGDGSEDAGSIAAGERSGAQGNASPAHAITTPAIPATAQSAVSDEPIAQPAQPVQPVQPMAPAAAAQVMAPVIAPIALESRPEPVAFSAFRDERTALYGEPVDLSDKERSILAYLREHPQATQMELAQALYISRSTVADYTAALQSKGFLAREGSRRAGRWTVLDVPRRVYRAL